LELTRAQALYGNKTITSGEGGIILTDHDAIAETCRQLKNHGRSHRGTFVHEHIGFNFSITEMQSAIGIAQLRKLPAIIQRKQEIYDAYTLSLANVSELNCLSPYLFRGRDGSSRTPALLNP